MQKLNKKIMEVQGKMSRLTQEEIFKPYEKNPIFSPEILETWPEPGMINAVFNPGAIQYKKATLLLVRVEYRNGLSSLCVAKSKNGKTDWKIGKKSILKHNKFGFEDARISYLAKTKEYLITVVSHYFDEIYGSTYKTYLMRTMDFEEIVCLGQIFLPENKDIVLFPKKFNGRYAAIHRPIIGGKANIWMSFSPDKKHWGDDRLLLTTRPGRWDSVRVGANTPPIEIPEKGWLFSYHGVRRDNYYIGFALLDLEMPWVITHRTEEWLLGPGCGYMRGKGDYPGAIFCCGDIWDKKTDEYRAYCGVGDKEIFLYTAKMNDLICYLSSCPV